MPPYFSMNETSFTLACCENNAGFSNNNKSLSFQRTEASISVAHLFEIGAVQYPIFLVVRNVGVDI